MWATWQEVCKFYAYYGRKAAQQQVARVYTWLDRHDRDRLEIL